MENRITAVLLAIVSFIVYPAMILGIAAGMSGCATEETVTPPPTETVVVHGPEDCTNGRDDDGDGLVDCADSNCSGGWCNSAGSWFGARDVQDNGAFYPNDGLPEEPPATTRTDDSFVDALFGSWWFRILLVGALLFFMGSTFREARLLDKSEKACAELKENLGHETREHHVCHSEFTRRESDLRQLITTLNRARLDDLVEILKLSKTIDELRTERDLACMNNRCFLRMLGVKID